MSIYKKTLLATTAAFLAMIMPSDQGQAEGFEEFITKKKHKSSTIPKGKKFQKFIKAAAEHYEALEKEKKIEKKINKKFGLNKLKIKEDEYEEAVKKLGFEKNARLDYRDNFAVEADDFNRAAANQFVSGGRNYLIGSKSQLEKLFGGYAPNQFTMVPYYRAVQPDIDAYNAAVALGALPFVGPVLPAGAAGAVPSAFTENYYYITATRFTAYKDQCLARLQKEAAKVARNYKIQQEAVKAFKVVVDKDRNDLLLHNIKYKNSNQALVKAQKETNELGLKQDKAAVAYTDQLYKLAKRLGKKNPKLKAKVEKRIEKMLDISADPEMAYNMLKKQEEAEQNAGLKAAPANQDQDNDQGQDQGQGQGQGGQQLQELDVKQFIGPKRFIGPKQEPYQPLKLDMILQIKDETQRNAILKSVGFYLDQNNQLVHVNYPNVVLNPQYIADMGFVYDDTRKCLGLTGIENGTEVYRFVTDVEFINNFHLIKEGKLKLEIMGAPAESPEKTPTFKNLAPQKFNIKNFVCCFKKDGDPTAQIGLKLLDLAKNEKGRQILKALKFDYKQENGKIKILDHLTGENLKFSSQDLKEGKAFFWDTREDIIEVVGVNSKGKKRKFVIEGTKYNRLVKRILRNKSIN